MATKGHEAPRSAFDASPSQFSPLPKVSALRRVVTNVRIVGSGSSKVAATTLLE
jgi:hypothetical protein